MNIILVGFKSCGKTTLARAYAHMTGMQFLDTDTRIEELHTAKTGSALLCRDIYAQHGAEYFRELEHIAVASVLWATNCIVATGGGVVLQPETRLLLQKVGHCVYVNTPFADIAQRLSTVSTPLFTNDTMENMYSTRHPLYKEVAHRTLCVAGGAMPEELAVLLQTQLSEKHNGK